MVEKTSLAGVQQASAIFKGRVDPGGEATTYRFEYVTEAEFEESEFAGAVELPAGGEAIGSGSSPVEVEQEATSLTPRTTYHLRLVATNPSGTTVGGELTFTTFDAPSSGLPDGRAYEQASPVDKNGNNIQGAANNVKTSPEGNGITFFVNGGLPEGEGSADLPSFLATRTASGWTTQGLLAKTEYGEMESFFHGLSEDLSAGYVFGYPYPDDETESFFEKNTLTGQYTLIKSGGFVTTYWIEYDGGSADNDHALLNATAALAPGAAEGGLPNTYLWDRTKQELTTVGVFNNGEAPAEGARPGPWDYIGTSGGASLYFNQEHHVISTDASRVFFTALGTNQLYMRVNPTQPQSAMSGEECTEPSKACTYPVSASQRATPDPAGPQPAKFITATADGSKVFFMSQEELTDDANTGAADNSNDLYVYDTESRTLTDLSASAPVTNPNGAEVSGILGMSADGSHVYFGAGGVLAPGATHGEACRDGNISQGICNVYLWDEGVTTFVSREQGAAWLAELWAPANSGTGTLHASRTSKDGETLMWLSRNNLTSFDSEGFNQLYQYRHATGEVKCISCPPSGEATLGDVSFQRLNASGNHVEPSFQNAFNTRNMSADGNRVFFETVNRLLAADTNGVRDVYEWEADGSGTCGSSDLNGGCLYLISTGTSPNPSYFGDSSESGNDAYFLTNQPLVGQDRDDLVDMYDARVGGGLDYQNPPPPSICTGESCRPPASAPPASESPATSSFNGPGNPKPKKKHHKKRHHKRKHHHRKHHKKHHQNGSARQQGDSR